MKTTIALVLSFLSLKSFSQQDTIWHLKKTSLSKYDTVETVCTILKAGSGNLVFQLDQSSPKDSIPLWKVLDFNFSGQSPIENPYQRNFYPLPKDKAVIYVYRTSHLLGLLSNIKIKYKDKKHFKIANNAFYIHVIDPGEITYYWHTKRHSATLKTEPGKLYFLQVDQIGGNTVSGPYGSQTGGSNYHLHQTTTNVGETYVKSMKKQSGI